MNLALAAQLIGGSGSIPVAGLQPPAVEPPKKQNLGPTNPDVATLHAYFEAHFKALLLLPLRDVGLAALGKGVDREGMYERYNRDALSRLFRNWKKGQLIIPLLKRDGDFSKAFDQMSSNILVASDIASLVLEFDYWYVLGDNEGEAINPDPPLITSQKAAFLKRVLGDAQYFIMIDRWRTKHIQLVSSRLVTKWTNVWGNASVLKRLLVRRQQ